MTMIEHEHATPIDLAVEVDALLAPPRRDPVERR